KTHHLRAEHAHLGVPDPTVFAGPTATVVMHHDPLAHLRLPIGHCRPQGSHDPAWFVATHHAAFGRRRPIRTQVATAKAAGAHGYDDLARPRHRIRKVL